jgi:sugar (pentulose or hexulose) kinase
MSLLGVDLGTSSAKAVLVDDRGEVVVAASAPCDVDRPRPGWAEADPERWWSAAVAATRQLPPAARAGVRAIGLSGHMHGAVLVDARGTAVRPAILWLDARSGDVLARWPEAAAQRAGNLATAGMTGPTLLWLAEREPASLSAARWVMLAKDWLRLRLTGEAATDPSDATGTVLADADGAWDVTLLASLGLARELFPAVRASAEAAGALRTEAAGELGLPAGVPVATGAGDTLAAAFGIGLYRERDAQLSIGSSAQALVARADRPTFSPRLNVFRSANPAGLPRWCQMAAMLNGGLALDWARRALGLGWDDALSRAFAPEAERSEAVFLPYLTGERTPWMDPHVRGAWAALGAGDGPGALMRAAFLGVAFGIRAGLEALREQGALLSRLRLAGGGTVHPAWRQLLADVLGAPLEAVSCPHASGRGAALLAGLAAGRLSPADLPALAPPVEQVVPPRGSSLDDRYARFRDLYARLAPWTRP